MLIVPKCSRLIDLTDLRVRWCTGEIGHMNGVNCVHVFQNMFTSLHTYGVGPVF